QEVKSGDIPLVTDDDGTGVRIVCGSFWGKKGPVDGIAADPVYLDVSVPPGKRKTLPVETSHSGFAYVFAGGGKFSNASGRLALPLALLVLVADCSTKQLAERELTPELIPHDVAGDVVRFTLAYNRGAAMSLPMGDQSRWPLVALSLAVLVYLLRLLWVTPVA